MPDITRIALQKFVITTSELTSTNFVLADKRNEIDDSYNISMFTVALKDSIGAHRARLASAYIGSLVAPNNDVTIY